jgi:hypothetical protein
MRIRPEPTLGGRIPERAGTRGCPVGGRIFIASSAREASSSPFSPVTGAAGSGLYRRAQELSRR